MSTAESSPPPSGTASQSPSSPVAASRWASRTSLGEATANIGAVAMGIFAIKHLSSLISSGKIDPTIGALLLAAVLLPSEILGSVLLRRLKGK